MTYTMCNSKIMFKIGVNISFLILVSTPSPSHNYILYQSLIAVPINADLTSNYNLNNSFPATNILNFGIFRKPRSHIRCKRFTTSPRLTISTDRKGRNRSVRLLLNAVSATRLYNGGRDRNKVPDRSRRATRLYNGGRGRNKVPDRSRRATMLYNGGRGRNKVPDLSRRGCREVGD